VFCCTCYLRSCSADGCSSHVCRLTVCSPLRRALLQEKGVSWRSHWGDVKPLIADDPRYAAMPRGDRDVDFRKFRDELEVRMLRSCSVRG